MNHYISLSDILLKCNMITYKTIGEILHYSNKISHSPLSKGYIGYIVENFFCTSSSNKAKNDFSHLDIELKTLPLNIKNEPLNSVFICSFSPDIKYLKWKQSVLYNKIKHILWVPYYKFPDNNLFEYKFLKPFFYKINKHHEIIIKNDWYNLLTLFYKGNFNTLNKFGKYLQIASHSRFNNDLIEVFDSNGNKKTITRMSFYLNKNFIKELIIHFSNLY